MTRGWLKITMQKISAKKIWERSLSKDRSIQTNQRYTNKKIPGALTTPGILNKTATTYSPTVCSTIGVTKLNFSVRNGKRWNLRAIVTWISFMYSWLTRSKLWTLKPKVCIIRLLIRGNQSCGIRKVNGQLVMLGFGVSTFTPASYQRHRLWRPWEI